MDFIIRPRRLRRDQIIRDLVRETRISKKSLIYPLFVKEGKQIIEEIPSMEGQYCYSVDMLPKELEQIRKAGICCVLFFGIPDNKDEDRKSVV